MVCRASLASRALLLPCVSPALYWKPLVFPIMFSLVVFPLVTWQQRKLRHRRPSRQWSMVFVFFSPSSSPRSH
eukprot:scaffold2136_cov117-Isochrysis_galbana.AAC.3